MLDLHKIKVRRDTLLDLKKSKGIEDAMADVAFVVDFSGSMAHLFANGMVQDTTERILPLGLAFDTNKSVDAYLFDDGYTKLPNNITMQNLDGYIKNEVIGKYKMGGTSYAPFINKIVKDYGKFEGGFLGIGTKPAKKDIPTFVIVITDGENFDKTEATEAIIKASQHGIFFQFIGIGNENFRFLTQLDDLQGRKIDNVDFFKVPDLLKVTDEYLYNLLMTEFPTWLKKAKSLGLIK